MNGSSIRRLRVLLICVMVIILDASTMPRKRPSPPWSSQGQLSILRLNEFGIADVGVGIDGAWHVTPQLAIEGTVAWFPGETAFETDSVASQYRVLGLVGVRSGITQGRFEIYGRGRVGFLRFGEQDSRICTLIFPATLGCRLASGYTALAADLGAGISTPLTADRRLRLRFDIGDLLVRYDLAAFRPNGESSDGFVGHNLLTQIGARVAI